MTPRDGVVSHAMEGEGKEIPSGVICRRGGLMRFNFPRSMASLSKPWPAGLVQPGWLGIWPNRNS